MGRIATAQEVSDRRLMSESGRLRFTLVAEGMVQAFYKKRTQLWSTAKLRVPTYCFLCGQDIAKGEQVYLPITHQNNRGERAHVECMHKRARPA